MSSFERGGIDWAPFSAIARTVLYEGQILYPYRPSALKNQRRWTFGTLHPFGSVGEPSRLQLQVLIESGPVPEVALQLSFLQAGTERCVPLEVIPGAPAETAGGCAGLAYALTARIEPASSGLWRLTAVAENRTPPAANPVENGLAMESAHLRCALMHGEDSGGFVSAQDPPPPRAAAAAACACCGVYPVLLGPAGERRYLLAAPMILEDHPRIAPQSQGDFCDATEIDELLTLRVLTLTEAERREARAAGGEARRILDQCAAEPEVRPGADLHGSLQPVAAPPTWDPYAPPPASVPTEAAELKVGDRVRLRPQSRPGTHTDIFDQVLTGRAARIQAIEQDLEGRIHLAVVADDDPGRDLGQLKQSGHRFFFTLEEIEPL